MSSAYITATDIPPKPVIIEHQEAETGRARARADEAAREPQGFQIDSVGSHVGSGRRAGEK